MADEPTIPIIDFDPTGRFSGAHLLAFLVDPYDIQRRRHFTAMLAAQSIECGNAHVERHRAKVESLGISHAFGPLTFTRYANTVLAGLLDPVGGLTALRDSPPPSQWEVEGRGAQATSMKAVGHILLLIARMQRWHPKIPASTKRAIFVLRELARATGDEMPPDRDLPQLWRRYGSVAPLHAAAVVFLQQCEGDGIDVDVALSIAGAVRGILAHAAWLRDFAASHIPMGASGPLLPRDRCIVLPDDIEPADLPLKPLDQDLLTAAMSYRAPVPAR